MQFIAKDGQQVELRILGYQYPTGADHEWDKNWLRIYVNVKSDVGFWQTVDSSLTTWEVKELFKWFNNLSQNQEVEFTEMIFVEPNLSFKLLGKSESFKTIQIRFDAESKPKSADEDSEYFVNFQFSNQELAAIASGLSEELLKFPVR
jgi:hypothetical protein